MRKCNAITKQGCKCKNNCSIKEFCHIHLQEKIKINISKGKWSSPKQAVAVSYSQTMKTFPKCKSIFRRNSPNS